MAREVSSFQEDILRAFIFIEIQHKSIRETWRKTTASSAPKTAKRAD